mgnify:FL=1
MGMAASQARLLTITARMHDVEYQAQSIQNAKIQLSTQSDEVYNEYLDALDATTLTLRNSASELVTATFNNMCGLNAIKTATGEEYVLKDSQDRLIVPADVEEAYNDFIGEGGSDAYMFAWYMLDKNGIAYANISEGKTWVDVCKEKLASAENDAYESNDNTYLKNLKDSMDKILEEALNDYNAGKEDSEKKEKFNTKEDLEAALTENSLTDPQKSKLKKHYDKYVKAEDTYRNSLYKQYAEQIYQNLGGNVATGYDEDMFNYYVNMFKKIQAAPGGCVSITNYDGDNGDAANNSDWLKNMIECGVITVALVKKDKSTGNVTLDPTSPSSDSALGYTTTTSMDKTALAKAEAKYEKATKEIDQKDKKFDMDLSKLETERTALKTEYESVKTVINDNIERTFKIFS